MNKSTEQATFRRPFGASAGVFVISALSLTACPTPNTADSAGDLAPADAPASAAVALTSTSTVPPSAAPSAIAAQPAPPLGPPGFLPPSKAGEHRVALAGCVTKGKAVVQKRSRWTRPPEKVDVATLGTGIVVAHHVNHACCLEATVKVDVAGDQITLDETIAGRACRCMCSSTVRTAIGLEPGDYQLTVRTNTSGTARVVHEGSVQVVSGSTK